MSTLSELPFKFVARTSEGYWGKADNVKDAILNANFRGNFQTKIFISAVNKDAVVDNMGGLCAEYGIHDNEPLQLKDFVSPETLLETTLELLNRVDLPSAKELAIKLNDFLWEVQIDRPDNNKPDVLPETI